MVAFMLTVIFVFSVLFSGCGKTASNETTQATSAVEQGKAKEDTKPQAEDSMAKYKPVDGKEYKFSIAPYLRAPIDTDAKVVKFDMWNIE